MEATTSDSDEYHFHTLQPGKFILPNVQPVTSLLENDIHKAGTNMGKSPKMKLYFYTALIFVSYTIYGIAYNIWGPTWMDLIMLLQSSQDQMSYGNSLMAIGYIFGSFTSPFLFEYFGRQIFIALYLLLIACSIFVTPLFGNYYVFLGMALLFGIGEGGFDTGINSWILEMWLDDNGPLMQSMYFFYGLGTFFSPLICLHFLSNDNFVDKNYQLVSHYRVNSTKVSMGFIETSLNMNVTQMGQHVPHHTNYFFPLLKRQLDLDDVVESSIEIPYIIISALLLVTAIIHLLCHFFLRYEADENATILRLKHPHNQNPGAQESSEKSKCLTEETHDSKYGSVEPENAEHHNLGQQSRRKIVILICIGGAMSCFYDGMENINFEYMTSFLVNTALAISDAEAAKLISAMSAAYTLARGLGILIIMKVPPKFLLLIDFFLIFLGTSLLYFSMDSSESGILAGLVLQGAGMATFMPCMFSYFEGHIRLTDRLCAILSLSCALVSTVDPIIVGHLITSMESIVLYINYVSLVVVAVAFTLFELVVMC